MNYKYHLTNQIAVDRFCAVKLADLNYVPGSPVRTDDTGELFVAPIINLEPGFLAVYATTNGDPIYLAQIEQGELEWVENTDREEGLSDHMKEVLSRADWHHRPDGEGYSYLVMDALA